MITSERSLYPNVIIFRGIEVIAAAYGWGGIKFNPSHQPCEVVIHVKHHVKHDVGNTVTFNNVKHGAVEFTNVAPLVTGGIGRQ